MVATRPAPGAPVTDVVTVTSRKAGRAIALTLRGEIDIASVVLVEPALDRALRSHDLVVLDLGEVTFIDLTGVRMVLCAHARAQASGRRLRISRVSRPVQRVFTLVSADTYLRRP